MGIRTAYSRWEIEPDLGGTLSVGLFGGALVSFSITGDREETFHVGFVGTGAGGAAGVKLSGLESALVDTADNVKGFGAGGVSVCGATGIAFSGACRRAIDFGGNGCIFEFSAAIGLGANVQVVLFNCAPPGPAQLVSLGELAWRVARDEEPLSILMATAPAVAMVACVLTLGADAGAMMFGGRWILLEEADEIRQIRPWSGLRGALREDYRRQYQWIPGRRHLQL